MSNVKEFKPKHTKDAEEILLALSKQDRESLAIYFAIQHLNQIQQGLDGEIDYEEGPFFEQVDKMYAEAMAPPSGCYFCDRTIDGNEVPFGKETKVCLTCQEKAANLLQAFGIHPRSLFPMMSERKRQEVLFEPYKVEKPDVVH